MRIACVLADHFEDSEFRVPYDRLKQAGHTIDIIGVDAKKQLTGKKGKEKVTTDLGIDDVAARDYDALFIPGGFSPDQLRADDRVVDFTRNFAQKPILAICHGPQLLITAELVQGKRMTAWKTVQVDLGYAGANVVDEQVVTDGLLVTSRKPEDLDAFTEASLRLLDEQAQASAPVQ